MTNFAGARESGGGRLLRGRQPIMLVPSVILPEALQCGRQSAAPRYASLPISPRSAAAKGGAGGGRLFIILRILREQDIDFVDAVAA